jgi:hypothetical protein
VAEKKFKWGGDELLTSSELSLNSYHTPGWAKAMKI